MYTGLRTPHEVATKDECISIQEGDEVLIRAKVTKVGKDAGDNVDNVTIQLDGAAGPVTLSLICWSVRVFMKSRHAAS